MPIVTESVRARELTGNLVSFMNSQGEEISAPVLRLMPYAVSFEVYDPTLQLHLSEVLKQFALNVGGRTIYSGNAVVTGLVNARAATICQVGLDQDSWTYQSATSEPVENVSAEKEFGEFLRQWQEFYLVSEEYKIITADLHTFLTDLRFWLEKLELNIRAGSEEESHKRLTELARELRRPVSAALAGMFERFEMVAREISDDLQPVHRAYGRRQLHSHLLPAPFIRRTFTKPLGYAGDYEMMNLIVRDNLEGTSLYAKLIDAYLMDQVGPQAVRNRVGYLQERIFKETARIARLGRRAEIFCIACGPAWEARNFLAESSLANQAHFHLLDFNEETLNHANEKMTEAREQHGRRTTITLARNSVQNLLRGRGRQEDLASYDMIYSSGLYDYLNDRIIKALNTYLYDRLNPGGLLVVGNFSPSMPVVNFIEHFLEWFLIYRDSNQMLELRPEQADPEECNVYSEHTGANIFLEVRKPA